jgi:hypothetical protein
MSGSTSFARVLERLLPAEVTGLHGMTSGTPSWTTFSFRADRNLLQGDRDLHLARQVGIVELVRVAQAFVGDELGIFAAKGMAVACGEIPEGHPVAAADPASRRWTVQAKPFGGSHFAIASASRNAR